MGISCLKMFICMYIIHNKTCDKSRGKNTLNRHIILSMIRKIKKSDNDRVAWGFLGGSCVDWLNTKNLSLAYDRVFHWFLVTHVSIRISPSLVTKIFFDWQNALLLALEKAEFKVSSLHWIPLLSCWFLLLLLVWGSDRTEAHIGNELDIWGNPAPLFHSLRIERPHQILSKKLEYE